MRPANRDGFEIAIICALTLEADPVEALFDKTYDKFGSIYGTEPEDSNTYITGRIGPHNVVLCYLPGMGKGSAASAAANLRMSYRQIQLLLLVGICGGVPFPSKEEIILGDVIISNGIVEYDFGRQNPDGFRRKIDSTEALGRPSPKIRSFLAALKGQAARDELREQTGQYIQSLKMQQTQWQRPSNDQDVLFEPSYRHKHYSPKDPCICLSCQSNKDPICDQASKSDCITLGCAGSVIHRDRLAGTAHSSIHIGKYASGDTVLKCGEHRDKLASAEGVIAFEMEGAGVWDNGLCIIIKGVCDYADSHKNKIWQPYAAAAAASASKALLQRWAVAPQQRVAMNPQTSDLSLALRSYYTAARRLQVQRISGELLPMDRCYINMVLIKEDRSSRPRALNLPLWSRLKVDTVNEREHVSIPTLFTAAKRVLIHGRAGVGKSTLCKKIMHDHINDGLWRDLFDLILWIPLRRLKRSSQQNGTLENAFYDLYFLDRSDGRDLAAELKKAMDSTQKDRILLILDGLDEVSQAWEPETPMHNLLIRLLEHPRVILTSRPYGLGNSDLDSFDVQLETVGFTQDQVKAYIKMAAKGDLQRSEDILAFVTSNEIIQHLVRIPVQLDAVCYSWDRNFMSRDSPKTMTVLYEAITLKLWQKDLSLLQQLVPSKNLAEDTIRGFSMVKIEGMIQQELRLVELLAFTGMHNGLVEFSADDRQRLYDALLQQGILIPDLPESILRTVSFLNTSDTSALGSDQTYHFLHLTFQEFFAARYLVRHWMEKTELECINLSERAPRISLTQPQEFLQIHKYNTRYDIMWRFTTGLLQDYPPQKNWSEDPVKHYFDQLDSEPRDILGPVHQRLLTHCLIEVAPGARNNGIRVRIEDQLLSWLLFEAQMGNEWGLLGDKECPEHLPLELLQRHSPDVDRTVMSAFSLRTSLSPVALERILALLEEDDENLQRHASNVFARQTRLPLETIETVLQLIPPHFDSLRVFGMVKQVANFPHIVVRLPLYQKSDDWRVRLAAGRALARQSILPPDGLDALLLLLQDPENEVRAVMTVEISYERKPLESALIEALIPLLNDEDSSVRAAAAKVWGRQDHIPSDARDGLEKLLQDKDDAVKVNAVASLSRHQLVSASSFSLLVPVLKKAELPAVSNTVWHALSALEEQKSLPPDIVEVLIALLQDGRGFIQLTISKVLSQQPPGLTAPVHTLLHDYSILRLYTDEEQPPPMPPDHQDSILRIFREFGAEMVIHAAYTLRKQAQLSPQTVNGLLQIMIADDNKDLSDYSALILSNRSVLPAEIKDQLFRLLESECSTSIKSNATYVLHRETDLPPQVIKALLAEAKKDTSESALPALYILYNQANLPSAILEELLPILNSKDSELKTQFVPLAMKYPQILSKMPAKYWGPLYKKWLEAAIVEQISWTLNGKCLCLDTSDGVTEVHFDRAQLVAFRREIRRAQLKLRIPADTLLPEPRWQDWFMSLVS